MKLATAFATLAVCLTAGIHAQTTNTTDAASTNATDSAANTTSALITGLQAVGNFKILASLIKMYPDEVAEWTSSGNNLTLLAPVDSALTKANKTLSAMSKEDVLALLQYHTLAGTFEASSLSATNHTIAPSLLVNETYAMLDGAPQGVVLSKDSKGTGIILENGKNISFAGQGISSGPLSLVPISDVLTIPGNLTTALKAAGFTSFAQVLAATNASMMLDMAESLTIMVPTNAALAKAGDKLKTLNATQLSTALAGHIFNGTVIYSSNFAETAMKAAMDNSTLQADGTILAATLVASAGQSVNVTVSAKNMTLMLTSGNYTTKVVSTDHLFGGGVFHGVDTVLLNEEADPEAAAAAAEKNHDATGATTGAGNSTAGEDSGAISVMVDLNVVSVVISALVMLAGVALIM